MSKEQNVASFYMNISRLEEEIRKGWENWNVQADRLEAVSDHILGTQMIALGMYSEFQYDVDILKVIFMLAIHELGEAVIGDIGLFEICKEEKQKMEHKAVHDVVSGLRIGNEIEKIFLEFEARETKEAYFAYLCDKIECELQCKKYDEEGTVDLNYQPGNKLMQDKSIQDLLQNGASWFEVFTKLGQQKYSYDENFMSVLKFAKNNDLLKLNKKKMPKEGNALKYYIESTRLKKKVRKDWKNWNVQANRLEVVSDHIFGTQIIAIAMYSEFQYDIDIKKVILMLAIHELAEARTGDKELLEISKEEKWKIKQEAVREIVSVLKIGEEIEKIYLEFETCETKESIFAKQCKDIECEFQAKKYDEQNAVDLNYQPGNIYMQDKMVQELLQKGASWFEVFTKLSQQKCSYDKNFMSVSKFAKNNDILKLNKKK